MITEPEPLPHDLADASLERDGDVDAVVALLGALSGCDEQVVNLPFPVLRQPDLGEQIDERVAVLADQAVDDHENVYLASGSLYRIAHKPGGGWRSPVELKENLPALLDLARDALGNPYVSGDDVSGDGVHKIEPNGKLVTVAEGLGGFGVAIVAGCKASCAVYVADGSTIKKVSPPFTGPTHGKITEIGYGFSNPDGVAAKGTDVYVADTGNVQVREEIP